MSIAENIAQVRANIAAAAKEAAAALKADYAQTYLAQPVKKF